MSFSNQRSKGIHLLLPFLHFCCKVLYLLVHLAKFLKVSYKDPDDSVPCCIPSSTWGRVSSGPVGLVLCGALGGPCPFSVSHVHPDSLIRAQLSYRDFDHQPHSRCGRQNPRHPTIPTTRCHAPCNPLPGSVVGPVSLMGSWLP